MKGKTTAPTTVIPGEPIVKNVYDNTTTKSVKYKKHVVVKYFSDAKKDDVKHYVKPAQGKQPAQIIIYVRTNDL